VQGNDVHVDAERAGLTDDPLPPLRRSRRRHRPHREHLLRGQRHRRRRPVVFTTWMNRYQLYAFIAGVVIIAAWLIRLVRRTGPGGGYAAAARAIWRQALVMGPCTPSPW
jgi:hypothetical protein